MSSSTKEQTTINEPDEEEEFCKAMLLTGASILPMILRAALELDLFEIIAKASSPLNNNGYLSAAQIAAHLPAKNPELAAAMLERVLKFLASSSLLTSTLQDDGGDERLYGLTAAGRYFVRDKNGVSLAYCVLLLQDKVFTESWYHMKDAILEGGVPFDMAHGMHAFEYPKKDERFNEVFNKGMYSQTSVAMKCILEKYKGFAQLKEIVDVGGGFGATLATIISMYPTIKGINFDLPHVAQTAPPWPGVEHVGGDMFESVPKGEVIFMKWILHDWSDEKCIKILKNCRNALPESGKVILVESILPENPEDNSVVSRSAFCSDMIMLAMNPGGRERTEKEYDALAQAAGFVGSKLICGVAGNWVIEIYKDEDGKWRI